MIIDAYLGANRSSYIKLTEDDDRIGEFKDVLSNLILKQTGSETLFIISDRGRYEFVSFAGEQFCICDRQADLYFNALAYCLNDDEEDRIKEAACYIAAHLLYHANAAGLANRFLREEVRINFHNASNPIREFARQFFQVFHEAGHAKFHNLPQENKASMQQISLFSFLSTIENAGEIELQKFEAEMKEECAVDLYALVSGCQFLKENDDLLNISFGGYVGFLDAALQVMVFQWAVERIKLAVDAALTQKPFPRMNTYDDMWRERILRRLANQVLIDFGCQGDLKNLSELSKRLLEKVYPSFQSELPALVYSHIKFYLSDAGDIDAQEQREIFMQSFNWS